MKSHLARLAAPRSWFIERKKSKWIMRSTPGPHGLKESLPIGIILRDLLKYAKVKKEVNFILNNGDVLVDKVVRRERKFPVGFMDVFELPKLNEFYRVVYNKKGRLLLLKINKNESVLKICKIIGKTILKGKKVQLNLFDGRNVLVDKDGYCVGDSIVYDLENNLIKEHLKLDKDSLVYLTGGKHVGYIGKVSGFIESKGFEKAKIVLDANGKRLETLKEYAFVIGKGKPFVSLEEK